MKKRVLGRFGGDFGGLGLSDDSTLTIKNASEGWLPVARRLGAFKECAMSIPYIPQAQSAMAAWARNFSQVVSATPGAFGLMESDAQTIATATGLYEDSLARARRPDSRTMCAVADKNAKQKAMLATLRMYAQMIKRNRGVSNDAKIGLGLTIDNAGRSPVPAPASAPDLVIFHGSPLCHRVLFRDSNTLTRTAKPPGVTGMLLMVSVGDVPPESHEAGRVLGVATRPGFVATYSLAEKGKTAYYFGCWLTGKGLAGPWSGMASLMIAA